MSTIQVRVKDDTKKSAKKILERVGLDMSSAVKLYLHQIVLRNGLPFRIVTENGLTLEEEEAIVKAEEEAERGVNVTKSMSSKEAIAYLKKL
jgi:addiction module RelB/DinJ family antitoxin